ncbi:MAG: DUF3493 domain-containing protein [Cyanobium sp.]
MAAQPRPKTPASSSHGPRRSLDPAMKERLLQESRTPWRGLRRALWFALVASAALGLATMAMRASAGEGVPSSDWLIQLGALSLFGSLLWFDRNRSPPGD